jgi:DNA polymerase III epsilon subunit-like protein
MGYTIFFDTETGGLLPENPTIQLASVVVDDATWKEIETFECKIKFSEDECDRKALEMNHYDRDVWAKEAVLRHIAVGKFIAFTKPYLSIQMISQRTGRPYQVGKLAGHNALTFDLPRLRELFGTAFFPFSYHVKDTLQRALWYFDEHPEVKRPESLKLGVLCAAMSIPEDGVAHDALADVRMAAALARAFFTAERAVSA